jgi:hypothetical protein
MALVQQNKKLCKQVILVMQIVILTFLLTNCKKTVVAGRVYSKYNTPVAGVNIKLLTYHSSKYAEDIKTAAITDNDGYYSFDFKGKHGRTYWVSCKGDTGLSVGDIIKPLTVNHIDMKFEY